MAIEPPCLAIASQWQILLAITKSLTLYRRRRLAGDVIDHPGDAFHVVHDAFGQSADVVVGPDDVGLAGDGAGEFEHVRVDGALGQLYRNPSTGKLHLSIP